MAIDIGRVAYEAYLIHCAQFQIEQTKWEDLTQEFQCAWRAVAVAVCYQVEEGIKQSKAGLIG